MVSVLPPRSGNGRGRSDGPSSTHFHKPLTYWRYCHVHSFALFHLVDAMSQPPIKKWIQGHSICVHHDTHWAGIVSSVIVWSLLRNMIINQLNQP